MSSIFLILMVIAMIATLAALGTGLYAMTRGGDFNAKYGNRLMQLRVALQAAALLLFGLAMLAGKGS